MSGLQTLDSRDIVGKYYLALEQETGNEVINLIANSFSSDSASETYEWVGQVPAMKEWIGARQAKGLETFGVTIKNLEYESTLEFTEKEMRRDKTGQLDIRISEQVKRAVAHKYKLLSALILAGESSACYDGEYFFDTDHEEGDSGVQSNDIEVDISALPVEIHGTPSNPSIEEAKDVVFKGIQQILGFKDNQGEPMNEDANQFVVLVPITLFQQFSSAATSAVLASGQTNDLAQFNVKVIPNVRLNAWTDKVVVIRTDGSVKPFIVQEEVPLRVSNTEKSGDYFFETNKQRFGTYWGGNTGYGLWQHTCLVKMI